jgi:3-dehydroquinate synthase
MKALTLKLEDKSYDIHIEKGSVQSDLLKRLCIPGNHVILTDHNIRSIYGTLLEGLNIIEFPAGEASKNMATYERVLVEMAKLKITRDGIILAIGGGVVGDLAGFVAATYMRGIKWVQIPTTLLAMVDSSVGGKVGINLDAGKNLVGAFYQPDAVYIDPEFLQTLPTRESSNGMAEVIKYGLGFDEVLFNKLEQYSKADVSAHIEDIITRCCAIKVNLVMVDEKDQGIRNLLNFGHTIGHAIEQHTNYEKYLHGESVAIGMAAMARIAHEKGDLPMQAFKRIIKLIRKFDLPVSLNNGTLTDTRHVLEAIKVDKKSSGGLITWIALKRIGALELTKGTSESAFSLFAGGLHANSKL